jgi:predicted RNA-binding protein YlxR (DUF448 family)
MTLATTAMGAVGAGPRPARAPIRTCVGCRAAGPQAELVRIATVDGRAVADPRRRLPGRGAYVHARPACVAAAARGGLARTLRRNVTRTEVDGLARELGVGPRAGGGSARAEAGARPGDPGIIPSGESPAEAVEIGSPSSTPTMSNPRPPVTTGNATSPIADAGAERSR